MKPISIFFYSERKKITFLLADSKKGITFAPSFKRRRPDGGIGRRAGLKHQWGNPSRFDPGSGYEEILVEHIYGGFSFIKTSKLVTFGRINAKCDHFLCLFETGDTTLYIRNQPDCKPHFLRTSIAGVPMEMLAVSALVEKTSSNLVFSLAFSYLRIE